MYKGIEWLKGEMDSMHRMRDLDRNPDEWFISKTALLKAIDQLDEPEVLSHEWVAEHEMPISWMAKEQKVVRVESLQNLIVPKQEEVDRAYKDGYEKGKQHATEKQSEETETVASVFVDFLIASAKLKLALSMEVEEMEE